MLMFHGSLENGKLLLWAERAFDEVPIPMKRRGRQALNPAPNGHPFAADVEQLSQALSEYPIDQSAFIKSLIWLPSQAHSPIPSNPVLGAIDTEEEPPVLRPWALWAYSMPSEQALAFLLAANGKEMLAPGVLLGKEFIFLGQLVHFILSLVARQRYLPSLQIAEKGFAALWTPVYLGPDKQRFCQLEGALPSLCRALTTSIKQPEPPKQSPQKCLESFIGDMIDVVVRQALEDVKERTKGKDSLHDAWLKALTGKKRALKANVGDGEGLMATVQEWYRPLNNTTSSPFKMCLRIEEPEETTKLNKDLLVANAPWNVSYFLQAYADPSLLVTTKDVWNPKGAKRKVLERPNFNPRQFVLTSLGMATGLCPAIEGSLDAPIPIGFPLTSLEASSFLVEHAPKLEEAGFGVICPNWWKKDKMKLSAKALVESPPFKSVRNRSMWEDLNTDWQVFLGDLGLSREELYQLALLKDPIIKMRGEWVLLNQQEIQRAIAFLEKNPYKPKTALDFLQLAAGIPEGVHGISIEGVEATGWVGEFLTALRSNSPIQILEPPKGFKGTLRPYQLRGFSWMSFLQQWQLGACLADDMGLGKTPQTLAMIMRGWEEAEKPLPTLLICPTSLTGNWSREAAKFVPGLPIHVHHGSDRRKGKEFMKQVSQAGLVITSYALLHRDEALLQEVRWAGIILDEAQNIKNAQTKQTKAAYKLKSDYRLALTGTPVENNVGDLWSIMHFLNPGYLGTQERFRSAFHNPIQIERCPKAARTLKELTKPLVLRRLKTDKSIISDLPDKMEMKVYCPLTTEQITLYETVVADANGLLDKAEGIERKGIILATLSKLKQVCNHPRHFINDGSHLQDRSGKLSRLEEMLEEVYAVGDRCLIFTQYSEMGELLKRHLEEKGGHEVLFLHGGTPKKQRDTMVERFQDEDAGPRVFILSLKAGGVGLNLTRANHVFHFDRWWNPAVENQATDRAFRIGQCKNVQVHKFICNGTIEERIDQMIESKKEVADSVVGTGEGWLTELSTDKLKELWALQKSAL